MKGTLNVLGSCAKTSSVKRAVVTSSLAAVAYSGKPLTPDVVVDETWFSSPDYCRETKVCASYCYIIFFSLNIHKKLCTLLVFRYD